MRKIILAALVVASLFASCSSEKTFKKKDGSTITAKPILGEQTSKEE